jgi:hypothetical protein
VSGLLVFTQRTAATSKLVVHIRISIDCTADKKNIFRFGPRKFYEEIIKQTPWSPFLHQQPLKEPSMHLYEALALKVAGWRRSQYPVGQLKAIAS